MLRTLHLQTCVSLLGVLIAQSACALGIGEIDDQFGVHSIATSTFAGPSFARSVSVQASGKILLASQCETSEGGADFCLARLTEQGVSDLAFGSNGVVVSRFLNRKNYPKSAVISANGHILMVGGCRTEIGVPCAVKYTPEGALDITFADSGIAAPGDLPLNFSPYGGLELANSQYLLFGACLNVPLDGTSDFCAIRLNQNGMLDRSFGTNGVARQKIGEWVSYAVSAYLDSQRRIVLSGLCRARDDFSGSGLHACIVRLATNGLIDATFGQSGSRDFPQLSQALVSQSDANASIIVGGGCVDESGTAAMCTVGLSPNGQGELRLAVATIPNGRNSPCNVSRLEQYGTGLLALGGCYISPGPSGLNQVFARFLSNGLLDLGFADRGVRVGVGTIGGATHAAFQTDGKLLLAGTCFVNNTQVMCAQRVLGESSAQKPLREMVEYRFIPLDYYFVTSRDSEKSLLDGAAGWARTGGGFNVLANSEVGSSPITRFYFDKVARNQTRGSHFYTALPDEVTAVQSLNPTNQSAPGKPVNEGVDSYAYQPTTAGTCAAGQTAVYRLFRGGTRFPDDPNHRFTTDLSLYNSFVALGWAGEGIKFCVPQ
jgi:uncharacterized delta-60 repeat protein